MVRAAFLFKSSRINYFNLDFIQDLTYVVFSSYHLSQFFACYSQLSPYWTSWPAKALQAFPDTQLWTPHDYQGAESSTV